MPSMPPVSDDPRLRRHRHRDQDRVDREDDVGQLDLDDRRPERRQARATAAPAAACGGSAPLAAAKKCWYDRYSR